MTVNEKDLEKEVKLMDNEIEEYYNELEEDPEREVSIQELINVIEDKIEKLEGEWEETETPLIAEMKKTITLICKILSVELNRQLITNEVLGDIPKYIS